MYDITVFPLNAVPVAKIQFNNFIKKNEKEIIRNFNNWEPRDETSDTPLISNTYRLFEEYNLYDLKNRFDECVRIYVLRVLGINVKFKNVGSWVTKNTKDTFHKKHAHPNAALSVVTYFDDEVQKDTNIPGIIFSPAGIDNIFKNFTLDLYDKIYEHNVFNSKSLAVNPKEDTVVIFPGYLTHESQPNNTESRYCIGSNYFFCDTFGATSSKNYVEIR